MWGWLLKTAELIRGDNQKDLCRNFRAGSIEHVAHRRVDSHDRFLDALKYGAGGQQSSIIISEGEGSGWGSFAI